jgi:hypothetical protein
MPAIQFPLSSSPGPNPQEGAGRLVNAMVEKLGDGARNATTWTRVPGMQQFTKVDAPMAHVHTRGMIAANSTQLLTVQNQQVYLIDDDGDTYAMGTLDGTDLVTVAKNNKTPTPDIVVVTANGAFNLHTSAPPSSFADPDLPQPNSVAFLGGYFIFTTLGGQIWASEFNDVAVDPLSFTYASARSDALLRGISFRNEFFAFGSSSIEVYQNAGLIPFPLSFVTMIPRGLAGKFAVAGWEEGWSNELIWAADDSVVYQLSGYSPVRISTHDVERAIESVEDKSTLHAFVFVRAGHAHWALKSPTWTWVYDLTTKQWHERESYLSDRWRASCSVKGFDRWICGDELTGHLYEVTDQYQYEGDDPLTFTIRSSPGAAFPARINIPRADFDFVAGVGSIFGVDPIETDPTVLIRWSNDAGATWSTPLTRRLGSQGETKTRVTVNRTGMAGPGGRVWELSCSDPVHIGLLGGQMVVEARAA